MRFLFGALVVVAIASRSAAQESGSSTVSVERLMTVEQFRTAGLAKLSPEELARLNAWLQQYSARLVESAGSGSNQRAQGNLDATAAVIETTTEGEFTGWDGETIFKLANGQIWQQASYAYTYHYAYRPKVLIYKSGATYKMKVDGVDATIDVRRLK